MSKTDPWAGDPVSSSCSVSSKAGSRIEQTVEQKRSRHTLAVAITVLVVVNALWGLSFPMMKSLNLQLEHSVGLASNSVPTHLQVAFTAGMIGLRFSAAFLMLFLCAPALVLKASRMEWGVGAMVATFFYFGLVLQVMGLATIPASRSGFLTSLTAVFTPLFSSMLYRRLPSGRALFGVLIAILGVSILTGLLMIDSSGIGIAPDALEKWTLGDTLTTLGSALFTVQLLLVDFYGKRVNSTAISPGMFLTVSLLALATFGLLDYGLAASSENPQEWRGWLPLFLEPTFLVFVLFLAFFCSVLAFVGMNRYQPSISATQASVIYSTEPVFASFWALFLPAGFGLLSSRYAYPNEHFSVPLIAGGALILVANVVALWPTQTQD